MRKSKIPTNQNWCDNAWNLDIENMPWALNTQDDLAFVNKTLNLTGNERILDLGCGIGRHAIEFARQGYSVVAVDLSEKLIERGIIIAKQQNLKLEYVCTNIREISFFEEFDVILNLWEGAIGYQSTDEENLEVFRNISRALKPGGQHLAGPLINADFARIHFPLRHWEKGEKMITLSEFQWQSESSTIHDTSWRLNLSGNKTWKLDKSPYIAVYRLYSPIELSSILKSVGLLALNIYEHPNLKLGVSDENMEYWIHSKREI